MKKRILTSLLAASLPAFADVSGDIRNLHGSNSDTSFTELELFYGAGSKGDMYTFLDRFYSGEYYGETKFTTAKSASLGDYTFKGRAQLTHNSFDAGFFSEYGFGIETMLPLPEKSPLNIKLAYSPFWLNHNGESINRHRLDWSFSTKKLPLDAVIFGFGDIDYEDGKFKIPYSQIGLQVPVGKGFSAGAGVNLFGDNDLSPDVEPYVELKYDFKLE